MKALQNLAGGFAGAVALNLLHETAKRYFDEAPRVDLVGEEALVKLAGTLNLKAPKGHNLYLATLAGDIVSNALYYSVTGMGTKKNLLARGAALGLAAGVGALALTKPMGLSDAPVTRTDTTRALTVALYMLGGLVTAATIKKLRK